MIQGASVYTVSMRILLHLQLPYLPRGESSLPRIFTCSIAATQQNLNFFKTLRDSTKGNKLNTLTTLLEPLNETLPKPAKMSDENIYDEIEIEVRFSTGFQTWQSFFFADISAT
jgi:hypothetical protein